MHPKLTELTIDQIYKLVRKAMKESGLRALLFDLIDSICSVVFLDNCNQPIIFCGIIKSAVISNLKIELVFDEPNGYPGRFQRLEFNRVNRFWEVIFIDREPIKARVFIDNEEVIPEE